MRIDFLFYSHVNYSVTKIVLGSASSWFQFYSHVNYSVTKIIHLRQTLYSQFYSHVNYSVTKIMANDKNASGKVLQSRKLFSY